MALIEDQPDNLDSTNALDALPDEQPDNPPAFLSFGSSPAKMDNAPRFDEKRTFLVRARCTGEHGPVGRKDGELRYTRTMQIQWVIAPGDPEPADPEEEQPGLFDDGDEAQTGEWE